MAIQWEYQHRSDGYELFRTHDDDDDESGYEQYDVDGEEFEPTDVEVVGDYLFLRI